MHDQGQLFVPRPVTVRLPCPVRCRMDPSPGRIVANNGNADRRLGPRRYTVGACSMGDRMESGGRLDRTLPPGLLTDESIVFLGLPDGGRIVAGAIATLACDSRLRRRRRVE